MKLKLRERTPPRAEMRRTNERDLGKELLQERREERRDLGSLPL
jgi:hypothetical protein